MSNQHLPVKPLKLFIMAQKGKLTTADYLPHAECVRLVERLHEEENYLWELYCVLAFSFGLRASDVLSLRWMDILDKKFLIKIEKKTQKPRKIKINNEVRARIKKLYFLMSSPDKENYAILNHNTHLPYSIWTVNRIFQRFKYKYALNIRAFSTHSFRKSFGRHVYDITENKSEALLRLQQALNHTDPQTTMCYIGLVQEDIDQIYDSISLNA